MDLKTEIQEMLNLKKLNGVLPAHASFWKIGEIRSISDQVSINGKFKGLVKVDLLHKPISTFFTVNKE